MRIDCPWCGPRPLDEFTYGGDATRKRPDDPDPAKLDSWMDYAYWRQNPAGPHDEYWHHSGGCHSWLIVTRDTTTHEIAAVRFAEPQRQGRKT